MHYARTRKHGSPFAGAQFKATCSVEGCEKPNASHLLCAAHLARVRRHGDPSFGGDLMRRAKSGEPLTWLLEHVNHRGDECLEWPFARDSTGYGGLFYDGRDDRAHRVMCRLAHGESPSVGCDQAAHSCGNGHMGCVNPNHLRWATARENALDKIEHGTILRGESTPVAKLTTPQVRAIRALALPAQEVAFMFGVSNGTVSDIRSRRSWAWLD